MSRLSGLPGCLPLLEVGNRVGATVNLAGVIADCRPPMMSGGSDWMITFKICDQTCPDEASSVSVRAFRPTAEQLPQISSNGDIIIIKSVKLGLYKDKVFGITSFASSWIISYLPSPVNTAPIVVAHPPSTRPQPIELTYIKGLRSWWTSIGGVTSSGSTGSYQSSPMSSAHQTISYPTSPTNNNHYVATNHQSSPINYHQATSSQVTPYQNKGSATIVVGSTKFALIRDMEINRYYDLIGLVVKVFPGNLNYTLYVTDYSKNSMLHSYEWHVNDAVEEGEEGNYIARSKGGDGKWPGPWGQYTLQVTLWDGHAMAARTMLQEAVGVYVGLRNVRAKKNKDGRLEGAMHGEKDPMQANLYIIENMKDQRVKDIIQRKKEYTRRFDKNGRQQEEQKAKIAQLKKEKAKEEADKIARQKERNENITCEQTPRVLTPIYEILNPRGITAPFVNRNYRIFCRVIDYLPPTLEEFSVPNTRVNPDDDYDIPTDRWVWRFALLVEDKQGKNMRVIVEGKDAEGFLGIDAVNLRQKKHEDTLKLLREKLFIVWGNLEENKQRIRLLKEARSRKRKRSNDKGPEKKRETDELGKPIRHNRETSSDHDDEDSEDDSEDGDSTEYPRGSGKMFDACIREYGVKRPGGDWQRLYRLYGTYIKM